ncbi:nipped-B-like protein A [Aplochiton taeniatus]
MNGDMPHVPITTLAGIASLTDLLNQLPLPSPLPATTTKSLLYNGRIADEVNCLLGCQDETLASQLAHSLNQVSTEHIELKDILGSDEPEGDAPMLLQTMLARNPGIFREKNVMQQPMQQYKITQNSMHSPAHPGNFQQAALSPNPSSHFVSPQSSSSSRFMGQQNSPVPSPYTPQSPAGYMQQYPHPPSYNQHQQIQQVSVASPMVPGGMRNIHEGKAGQIANIHPDDYMNIVHRLGNEEVVPAMRNASLPLKPPQSGCSPAESDGTPKPGSRPPLILQPPPPYATLPRQGTPDALSDKKQQQKKKGVMVKEEKDLYDIVSSPSKDSTKLTLRLSRVKSSESDPSGELLPGIDQNSDLEGELGYQQVPVLQQNLGSRQQSGAAAASHPGCDLHTPPSPYDDTELDAMAEIERIEREAAGERCSKEVQDKDKPLKKRKQDSFPLELGAGGPGGPTGAPGSGGGGGGNAGKLIPQEATAAGNGASRPALMVSIDLQQAGRADGQLDPCMVAPIPALEAQRWPQEPAASPAAEGSDTSGVLRLKPDGRPDVIKDRLEKHDRREPSRHRYDGKERRQDTSKSLTERDRDRTKRQRGETGDRRSPEERFRADRDSPRVKQEGRGGNSDCSGRSRSSGERERPIFGSSSGGDPGRSANQADTTAPDFPAQLLGGHTGALKNFQIPKVKRIKDGEAVSCEPWNQPSVKLRRLALVEDLRMRPKPVVVLQKLSIDQVQRFISHSKSGKNRLSSGRLDKSRMDPSVLKELPPELLAEIESTMPLCERVKMNKRKRTTVNEKPKYAEVSSDDGNDSNGESARKCQRRDRGRAWEDERERRGSGDPRRIGGFQDRRRGSGSRYRDSSEEESPPPSMSEVARQMMKRKEKQKKRKAYEPKLTQEELMDSSTFKRFSASIDNILESLDDVDFSTTADEDEIPEELLLGKHQLNELGSESAKIKAMGITSRIPSEKLVKVLNILEKNILDGSKLSTLMNHDNDAEDEERLWRDLIMERVTKSADACLMSLNIMTSVRMPKAVYIEDVIERVLQYTKYHLQNTLYPQYDPVYRVDPHGGGLLSSKAKRAKCSSSKQRVIVMLYNKVCDIVGNISELLEIQLLTDTTILQVSSMGITPFFVEGVSELQLCAIKLVTAVFSRYEKHRQLILEEIFTSLARLPTSKRSLRNFRLNSSDKDGEPMYIQMVTALVLQLIQCVVHLPNDKDSFEDEYEGKMDQDVLITNSYETAMRTAQNFLSVFLKKCGSKQGEEDYRPLFENFVQDLLSTVNKPEWPAAELLLSLLGRLLVHQFSNKQTEMALRVASLDYLGTVAARLRKDAVTSKMDQRAIDRILLESPGNDETQKLQKALLDYLEENSETDPSLGFARKFYIAQWFRDTTTETEKAMRSQNQKDDDSSDGPHHAKDIQTTGEIMQRAEKRKKFLRNVIKTMPAQFATLRMNSDTVDYDDSCLIVRYLASMRPFAQSFDIYLTQILRVLGESAIAVRTKAMKCLSEVVAVDPSILARLDMQRGVHGRLMDNSTSVREAAVELLGRFVLSRPQLTEQYYDMLIERILDTGISVRKRVIKILRDICLEQPTFSKITEMCVRMIRRVNDEEGIKKLVNETFQKLWFTPTAAHDKETMTRKILNITDVVAACKDTGYDWLEQLLQNLFKTEEDATYKPAKKACVQLVDNLVEHILKNEESLAENKGVNSTRLVACITTLYMFSKIRAQLMVKHTMTMQPYLTTKCNTASDFMVICNVAKILELVVPLMEHPSETFLATIEEDLMKLIIKHGMTVVQHCVSCLGAVVNKVTHNYKFVWACFNRFYGALNKLKLQHQEEPSSSTLAANKPFLLRSLFTVGALGRHFDFDLEEFKGTNKVVIKEKVLELLLYFTKHEDEEVQTKAIIGLGFLVIMHPSQMFVSEVKALYNGILASSSSSVNLKIQILKNLQTYLQEEDSRMQEADREWKKLSKQEDLKEMGDISSGMSSSIMQLYLKQVLEAFFHSQSSVRHFALNVIALTLNQGLIHPVQCVPYLVAMGTDAEASMRNKADQQLVEIDKKYTGFIHMKAVAGMKMSFQVQQAIASSSSRRAIIRGFRQEETNTALCSHLYSMVRGNRQHRRAFLISLLNLFDDSSRTEVTMLLFIADNLACFPFQSQEEPLFIMHHIDITLSVSGSNLLQTFKESLMKEPRARKKKVMKERERKNSSDGVAEENEMNCYSRSEKGDEENSDSETGVRRPKKTKKPMQDMSSESDSDLEDLDVEDAEKVIRLLPENATSLLDFANASQGILLLLVLKQHLKTLYGFSDSKIQKYSPMESAKVYDKAVNRKSNVHFSPRQTLDFLSNDLANATLTYEIKKRIVKQYLDFKVLMEHLDPDEDEEEGGEASSNIRTKAINALLGGPGPMPGPISRNQAGHETDDDYSDGEERTPGSSRRARRLGDPSDLGNLNETLGPMDVIALCCPKYKDRPQIARVIQKTANGYSVLWMAGSYSGPWVEAKKRDGRKLVPWVDTIKESDIMYKKISLTSNHKLSNKVAQTLRLLYAARDGGAS